MDELAKPAIEAVKDGRTKFIPERFEKNYFHWLDMIHDWCISRQLWWGHRIPAWYCDDCGEITVSKHPAKSARTAAPPTSIRRGHARHMVLVGALAVLNARLARQNRGP